MADTILVVDDNESILEVAQFQLEREGYRVVVAQNGAAGYEAFLEHSPELVISDIIMPEIDGIQLLNKIKSYSTETMFIVMTAHGSVQSAVEAMQLGACDYLEKPFSGDVLKVSVKKALRVARLERENKYLRQVARDKFKFENIVGSSPAMQKVYEIASRIAPRNSTVLIYGESGTGKELLAKAIHFHSKRKDKPFIPINVGAIPEHLVDSELFGHEKGAFTGAVSRHRGAFERAHGGTLFLDEIADMLPEHQVRLLRVLQEGIITRVGGEEQVPVDVRIISASNRNLEQLVEESGFREDLYFRLAVVPIRIPPLRERRDDIPLLLEHFIAGYCNDAGVNPLIISDEAMKKLILYRWPGNVRELQNAVERLVAVSVSDEVGVKDLPDRIQDYKYKMAGLSPADLPDDGIVLEEWEKNLIAAALEKNNHNQSATARYLSIPRNTLLYRMDKYEIGH